MAELSKFSEAELLAFALVLMRTSSFIAVWPLYSATNVPALTKILLALTITLVVFPIVGWQKLQAGWQSELLVGYIIKEVCTGLMLGFLTRLCFIAVSGAGEMMSVSMGLSNAQLFNPALATSSTSIEQLKTILASLIFLAINGHHVFLHGLVKSFLTLPLYEFKFNGLSLSQVATIGQGVLESSVRMAAPVVVTVLVLNIGMGIIGRAVPQINVLSLGFSVTIFGGLIVLMATLPFYGTQVESLLAQMSEFLFAALKVV